MLWRLMANGLEPERNHRFDPKRRWRFDFAFHDQRVAVEIEGGTWSGGRHVRPRGYQADCEKYNRAVALGWRVLRYTGDDVTKRSAEMLDQVVYVLNQRRLT